MGVHGRAVEDGTPEEAAVCLGGVVPIPQESGVRGRAIADCTPAQASA